MTTIRRETNNAAADGDWHQTMRQMQQRLHGRRVPVLQLQQMGATMNEQQQALADLGTDIDIATGAIRRADDAAYGKLHSVLNPELRGHISIARQHAQEAQRMLAQMAQGATNG